MASQMRRDKMAYIKNEDELKYETAELNDNTDVSKKVVKTSLNGVDDALTDEYNTPFVQSSTSNSYDAEKNNAASSYKDIISTDNIISDNTWNNINRGFVVPSAVKEADAYLSNQLKVIQSGKTSYSDQVKEMMDKIANREKFSYDVDTDPLFQQALASAMNSGKQAMQDTIGQASALTGGYGSTYATTAGNQAYNSFIEDAYDNVPQYYQMAMEAYQMEGDEMYRQLGMYNDADDKEYNRNVTAYDATYQHRNQLYNEAYTQYRDNKSDAIATANLELSEYGQRVSDAYNYYNIASDQANTQYEREYTQWSDSINRVYQMMQMQNNDWWNQTNFDESVRQYEKTFAENVRQYDQSYAQTEKWNQKELDYKYYAANKSSSGSGGSDESGGHDLSPSEINAVVKVYNDAGGGDKGKQAALGALQLLGKPVQSAEQVDALDSILSGNTAVSDSKSGVDWTKATITKTEDTTNGIFGWGGDWHIDSNDVYTVNGKTYYADDIKAAMEEDGIPDATIEKLIKDINKLGKNGTYTYSK